MMPVSKCNFSVDRRMILAVDLLTSKVDGLIHTVALWTTFGADLQQNWFICCQNIAFTRLATNERRIDASAQCRLKEE